MRLAFKSFSRVTSATDAPTHLADRRLGPNRLAGLLTSLAEKRASSNAEVQGRASIPQGEIERTDDKLRRLYKMVEDGVTDIDDVLGDRLAALKSDRERAKAALERIKIQSAPNISLESDQIERFGSFMRERITTGETTFHKAYLRSIVDAIEVDDKVVRIHGSKVGLEQAVIAGEQIGKGVRSFIRKWRTRHDSNVWPPPPSEGNHCTSPPVEEWLLIACPALKYPPISNRR